MKFKPLLFGFLILLASAAQAYAQFKVLHAFGSGSDGGGVWDSVVFDKQGNLYGTTSGGGDYGYGTIFELSPESNGQWTETVLQSFKQGDPNGAEPNGGWCSAPPAISTARLTLVANMDSALRFGSPLPRPAGCTA
jgi:uncharacterized repeat protein (TIGR03803 family)